MKRLVLDKMPKNSPQIPVVLDSFLYIPWKIAMYEKKYKKIKKNQRKPLHLQGFSFIIQTVVTLIALKREVAAGFRRFSVERMSS